MKKDILKIIKILGFLMGIGYLINFLFKKLILEDKHDKCCYKDNCNCDEVNSFEINKEENENFTKRFSIWDELKESRKKPLYYDEFFDMDVYLEYKTYIEKFLANKENYKNILFTKDFNVFYNGDFNYCELKNIFVLQYDNIVKYLSKEELGFGVLSVKISSLEDYLNEIDKLSDEENVDERVLGVLSYWAIIGQAMNY